MPGDGLDVEPNNTEQPKTEGEPKLVPVEALQAERKARQELEARLAKIESDRKAAEEKAASEAGEYRKLYEPLKGEHEAAKAKLAEYEAREQARVERVKARNDERIKALPEKAAKALEPIATKLSPDDLADWLDTSLSSLLPDEPTVTRPAGTVSNSGKKHEEPIPSECKAEWEKYGKKTGISERDWFEHNWKRRHPTKSK